MLLRSSWRDLLAGNITAAYSWLTPADRGASHRRDEPLRRRVTTSAFPTTTGCEWHERPPPAIGYHPNGGSAVQQSSDATLALPHAHGVAAGDGARPLTAANSPWLTPAASDGQLGAARSGGVGDMIKVGGPGMHLYTVGGRQRELRPLSAGEDWYEYQNGVVLDVDTTAGTVVPVVEYVSPPEVCPPEGGTILFKSGSILGDTMYLVTQTEILLYRIPTFERVGYLSLPMFNDLHHVIPTQHGTLIVANTGLDMVLELTPSGEIIRQWNVLDDDPWTRFSPAVDYRRVRTTKPHLSHPNYVFLIGDDVWATRFEQRDAVCLTKPGFRIEIGIERVHDGVPHEGRVYFTTVDGHLVIADPERCVVEEVVDLNAMAPADIRLGWCRSVYLEDDHLWVGFSRIRPTKFRENVGWALRGFKRDLGTHIGGYDLKRRERVEEILVEPFGLNAIFAIFPAGPATAVGRTGASVPFSD